MNFIQKQAFKLRPELENLSGIQLTGELLNSYAVMLNIPLLLIGLAWLVVETNLTVIQTSWQLLLVLFGITVIFSRFRFELQFELGRGVMMTSGGTLRFIVIYSAAFIFGPTAIWLAVIDSLIDTYINLRRDNETSARWRSYAQMMLSLAPNTISLLTGLKVYQLLGGAFPLPDLTLPTIIAAVTFLIIDWLIPYILLAPILIFLFRSPDLAANSDTDPKTTLLFIIFSSALPNVALPFTILAAGLYALSGAGLYIFFLSGALLANILASKLTDNVRQRTQRARELAALEKLGRLIIEAPPDGSTLPEILTEQFPQMFFQIVGYIWLNPDNEKFKSDRITTQEIEIVKSSVADGNHTYYLFTPEEIKFPKNHTGLAVAIQNDQGEKLGGVYIRGESAQPLDYLPAVQALAAQIASALFRSNMHQETLQKERMTKELELAGRIQSDFLPEEIPDLPGYQIAASLTPALQTSGDFYDLIPLPGGKLGILVADVADKGTGAALFGALTRTLIRTYALEHPDEPELVLQYANARVMSDTQSQLFVTTFYGVIDPVSNTLKYVNGGHNPTYLFPAKNTHDIQSLIRTGIPIGIMDEAEWKSQTIDIHPEDILVFYTDGVTEAQTAEGTLFDDDGLQNAVKAVLKSNAAEIHDSIIQTIRDFIGSAPQFDDLTLAVIKRDA